MRHFVGKFVRKGYFVILAQQSTKHLLNSMLQLIRCDKSYSGPNCLRLIRNDKSTYRKWSCWRLRKVYWFACKHGKWPFDMVGLWFGSSWKHNNAIWINFSASLIWRKKKKERRAVWQEKKFNYAFIFNFSSIGYWALLSHGFLIFCKLHNGRNYCVFLEYRKYVLSPLTWIMSPIN